MHHIGTLCMSFQLFCAIILLHSAWINGQKFTFVRNCADISAASVLLSCIMVWISGTNPTQLKTAVFYDLFNYGILGVPIHMCDIYLFLNRFQAVKRVSFWKKFGIHSYIWTLMTWYWLATYTIVPFFMSTNTEKFNKKNALFLHVGCSCSILYTLYFTAEFTLVLRRINSRMKTARISASKIITIKSILHCFTSCLADLLFASAPPPYPNLIYNFIVVCNCHLIFNFKIETSTVFKKSRLLRSICLIALPKKNATIYVKNKRSQSPRCSQKMVDKKPNMCI